MPLFHYQARNAQGQPVAGQVQAESLAQAVAALEGQGLSVQQIGSAPAAAAGASSVAPEHPFAQPDDAAAGDLAARAALQAHMQQVLERGRIILPALRAYAQELPAGRRRRQLELVLRTLASGDAAEATRTLALLPGYWIPLLGAATASRDPGRILREFLDESERAAELHRQWWLTLAYPLLLASLAACVLIALSFFVIPIFRDIFAGFGLRVPPFTQFILTAAEWITSGRVFIVAIAIAAPVLLLPRLGRLLPAGVRNWFGDRVAIRFGRTTAIARFAQFTADLLESQLDLPAAVRVAAVATGSAPLRRAAWRLAGDLESGSPWVRPATRNMLTATVLHALARDAAPAARIRLLREISACYAERARIRLSWTQGIVEPLAICAIGLVIGATVLAMFLPLVTLIHGLA